MWKLRVETFRKFLLFSAVLVLLHKVRRCTLVTLYEVIWITCSVKALKEFQDKDYEDAFKRPVFFPEPRYKNEELKYYCKNCKTAAFQTCVTLNHNGHAFEHRDD